MHGQAGAIASESSRWTRRGRVAPERSACEAALAALPGAPDAAGAAWGDLTREEICRELWPEGTFVDYEHGVNSAVNRLREALGDKASNPRFIETLARRGYRFLAPVERITRPRRASLPGVTPRRARRTRIPEAGISRPVLAAPEDLPKSSHSVVQTLVRPAAAHVPGLSI